MGVRPPEVTNFWAIPLTNSKLSYTCLLHARQLYLTHFFKDFLCWRLYSLPRKAARRRQEGLGDRTKASSTK